MKKRSTDFDVPYMLGDVQIFIRVADFEPGYPAKLNCLPENSYPAEGPTWGINGGYLKYSEPTAVRIVELPVELIDCIDSTELDELVVAVAYEKLDAEIAEHEEMYTKKMEDRNG